MDVFFSTDISFVTMEIVAITVGEIVFSALQLVVQQFPAMCLSAKPCRRACSGQIKRQSSQAEVTRAACCFGSCNLLRYISLTQKHSQPKRMIVVFFVLLLV